MKVDLNKEPSLTQLKEKLFDLVNKGQLTFTIEADSVVETYVVDNIMSSQSPERYLEQKSFKLTTRGAQINVKASPETSLESKTLVTSLGDCFLACRQELAFICESVSYCRDDKGSAKCILSSIMSTSEDLKFEASPTCDIYGKAYGTRFIEVEGSLKGATGEKKLQKVTQEECARQCTLDEEFECQSFAFCGGDCLLKKGHALIDNGVDKTKKETVDGKECTLFTGMLNSPLSYFDVLLFWKKSVTKPFDEQMNRLTFYMTLYCSFCYSHLTAKHLYEYTSSLEVLDDKYSLKELEGESADVCGTRCSLAKECSSFNYCALTAKSTKSTCNLLSAHPQEDVKKSKKENCRNYFKAKPQSKPDEPPKPPATPTDKNDKKGYISGGKFTGIIFAMIFTGLVLGVLGQLGWIKWKARREEADGLGVDVPSVKWVRQKDEQ